LRSKVGLTPVGRAVRLTIERDRTPRDLTVAVGDAPGLGGSQAQISCL
jgi:hypothetical protein